MITKVLVANRGEIAARVMRTAKDMGFRTVAVFSQADAMAPHVQIADEAVCIGEGPVGDSYLSIEKVLDAAKKTGADAIHPGYGFLSENADFANACEQAGITFVGPNVSAIELMASKRQSKIAMIEAGVPCIPGYEGASAEDSQNDEVLIAECKRIGLPVMIKASAGGGGRGMRLVHEESELANAISTARSEAKNAFGNDELIVEKAITGARHIEIQVFADNHGNAIHLAERDCSVQRRHQKVIEEAPSVILTPDLREEMGLAAVNAAKACEYRGAGTVEFLFDDKDNKFYFLEMNTRLQVEHPVTELITGLDLVELQLRVANNEVLPLSQNDVTINGHAMEVRLYAEDPANQFLPQTGNVLMWQPATHDSFTGEARKGTRVDSGIVEGQTISAFYDPMLAKLIVHGENRDQAVRKLIRLIEDSHLLGVKDNRAFLVELLNHPTVIAGNATTDFIGTSFTDEPSLKTPEIQQLEWMIAAVLYSNPLNNQNTLHTSHMSERFIKLGFGDASASFNVEFDNLEQALTVKAIEGGAIKEAWQETIKVISVSDNVLRYEYQGVIAERVFAADDSDLQNSIWIESSYGNLEFIDASLLSAQSGKAGSDKVVASMDGAVVDIKVSAGDNVKAGDTVAVIEAMKMEHPLKAEVDAEVSDVLVSVGDQVKGRQLMVQLKVEDQE